MMLLHWLIVKSICWQARELHSDWMWWPLLQWMVVSSVAVSATAGVAYIDWEPLTGDPIMSFADAWCKSTLNGPTFDQLECFPLSMSLFVDWLDHLVPLIHFLWSTWFSPLMDWLRLPRMNCALHMAQSDSTLHDVMLLSTWMHSHSTTISHLISPVWSLSTGDVMLHINQCYLWLHVIQSHWSLSLTWPFDIAWDRYASKAITHTCSMLCMLCHVFLACQPDLTLQVCAQQQVLSIVE